MTPWQIWRRWPTAGDYDEALQNRASSVYDPDIRNGQLIEDEFGPINLNSSTRKLTLFSGDHDDDGQGKYVCVYQVGDWIVRCLTRHPPSDLQDRYSAINTYLARPDVDLPFLISYTWVPRAIQVNGGDWPFIKVPVVPNSRSLGTFLSRHHADQSIVASLADQWLWLIQRLERFGVAHGDFDVTNVLVRTNSQGLSLCLVDYDGMYVPGMENYSLVDRGHEHFQSPDDSVRRFGPDMDRFSALVIYISLLALARDSSLWEQCGADESTRLLLGSDDFEALRDNTASEMSNFGLLLQQPDPRLQTCLEELRQSIWQARMPASLSDLISQPAAIPISHARLGARHPSEDVDLPLYKPRRPRLPL